MGQRFLIVVSHPVWTLLDVRKSVVLTDCIDEDGIRLHTRESVKQMDWSVTIYMST